MAMKGINTANVLYIDHQGHPAPLSMCYHATASRRLASAAERQPPSTITEVDSAFCPQCLSFHDATTAANLGFCPKATCRLCPLCRSVASIGIDEESSDCLYKCGLCDWTSRQCSLFTSVAVDEDGAVSKEDLDKASDELQAQWTERRMQRDQQAEDHFKTMLRTLEGMAKEHVRGQRSTFSWLPTANVRRKDGPEGWSIEALEDSLQHRKKLISTSLSETIGGQDLQFSSLFVDQFLNDSLQDKSIDSILLQGGGESPASLEALLPLPVPLRPRKSRRCRAELAEGRPGILVKPKLNPLEGDSSLRTGHAQWWKKDSSAVQVLPRVNVSKYDSDETKHVFLLKVSNPTLGTIRMRLDSSEYSGEPLWGDFTRTTPLLQKVLVDPFTGEQVDAELDAGVVKDLAPTEICELEPAEDSFLELGKTSNDIPDSVANWDASQAMSDSEVSIDGHKASLRFLASRSSFGWFELVVLGGSTTKTSGKAVPLAIQIEVGNGSWESSLVMPEGKDDPAGSREMVTFNLLITWVVNERYDV